MRKVIRATLLGLMSLLLVSCAGKQAMQEGRFARADRTELLARLQLGQPVLDCREACLDAWKKAQPAAMQLDSAAKWDELAVLVIRTGYDDDLSLYYLGRAAEGRGFYAAAATYYRQSTRLSGTAVSCVNLSHLCGGVSLPKAASERLAVTERLLSPPKKPRRRPAKGTASPPAEPPAAVEEPVPVAEPTVANEPVPPAPPPASIAVPLPPPPPSTATGPERGRASDYIEPPPAR
jgi:hypothetical protein